MICNVSEKMRARIIFLLWRAWHHSNNVVHGDGKASIAASAPYLCTYHESFSEPRLETTDCKGKAASFPDREISHVVQNAPSYWSALVQGSFNANVDAGWDHHHNKHAGIWVIIRDHRGARYYVSGSSYLGVQVLRRQGY